MLELIMPPQNVTWKDRLSFAHQVREKLRRSHNQMGTDYRAGRISQAEWERFLAEEFGPRNAAVTDAVLGLRAEIKDAARSLADDSAEMRSIDLDTAFEDAAA